MICGERYFLRLTPDKVDQALAEARQLPAQHQHAPGPHLPTDKKH